MCFFLVKTVGMHLLGMDFNLVKILTKDNIFLLNLNRLLTKGIYMVYKSPNKAIFDNVFDFFFQAYLVFIGEIQTCMRSSNFSIIPTMWSRPMQRPTFRYFLTLCFQNLSKLVPNCPNLYKLVQSCSNFSKHVKIGLLELS